MLLLLYIKQINTKYPAREIYTYTVSKDQTQIIAIFIQIELWEDFQYKDVNLLCWNLSGLTIA